MNRMYPILLCALLLTPISKTHTKTDFKPTHKEQYELQLLRERDKTKIKLAIIGAIVALGTTRILHSAGYSADFNALIEYLMSK